MTIPAAAEMYPTLYEKIQCLVFDRARIAQTVTHNNVKGKVKRLQCIRKETDCFRRAVVGLLV